MLVAQALGQELPQLSSVTLTSMEAASPNSITRMSRSNGSGSTGCPVRRARSIPRTVPLMFITTAPSSSRATSSPADTPGPAANVQAATDPRGLVGLRHALGGAAPSYGPHQPRARAPGHAPTAAP